MTSGKYTPVPDEITYDLIRRAQKGDEKAREKLVIQNTGLVKKLALKFSSQDMDFEDFVQIGYVGLLKAVEKFDTGFGVKFSTYAVPMILGEMKQSFRDSGKIKVSRSLKSDIYKLKSLKENYMKQTGKEIRIGQLAEEMNVSVERVIELINAENSLEMIASLDSDDVNLAYQKNCITEEPEEYVEKLTVRTEIDKLPELMKLVISMRYYRDMTQSEVAKLTGISQVQISRMEKKAINCIREKIYSDSYGK